MTLNLMAFCTFLREDHEDYKCVSFKKAFFRFVELCITMDVKMHYSIYYIHLCTFSIHKDTVM